MRAPRVLPTLDEVDIGDHVCHLLDRADDVIDRSRAFVADGALHGDKVVIVGSAPQAESEFAPLVLDPARLKGSLLAAVRREAAAADREGFRSLRVLHHVMPSTRRGRNGEWLRSELDLEEFAADTGAMVVCAYSGADWDLPALQQISCVHPHHVGSRSVSPAFRVYRAEEEGWTVTGTVDSDGAVAFGTILCALLAHAPTVRLLCHTLEFFDAAGMSALADAARHLPERKVVLEGANETVRLAWKLSGFAIPDIPVVMAP
ncbi:MEDS domain-containing protein [Streptomyces actinomycinicus]|uniref:MEDS domain-containing protein n=1 Tax=Streptomyces actinomycinicus TaxID=1695166 RepID=A0A937JQI8_9ACTN|nr:MEDS domain-containing protein [Streptomyces actinomycinicus]MBL1083488.1 MEDS domain-containing protein [Streptomyces actinomycinicus]